jgi:hypothetical protein
MLYMLGPRSGGNDVPCTKDELSALDVLGAKLADASTTVQKKTGSLLPGSGDFPKATTKPHHNSLEVID